MGNIPHTHWHKCHNYMYIHSMLATSLGTTITWHRCCHMTSTLSHGIDASETSGHPGMCRWLAKWGSAGKKKQTQHHKVQTNAFFVSLPTHLYRTSLEHTYSGFGVYPHGIAPPPPSVLGFNQAFAHVTKDVMCHNFCVRAHDHCILSQLGGTFLKFHNLNVTMKWSLKWSDSMRAYYT